MSTEHLDVLIVGAGLSGIGAAWRLQHECPEKSYAILEGREAIGGTWDLFRFPGIRSDSDMYTLGYGFKPWTHTQVIADGPMILDYIRETARESGVDRKIRFGHKVVRAAWSSEDARWTVEARRATGEVVTVTCRFLMMCTGYYNYEAGYTPEFKGRERFQGRAVHPQFWPEDLDYSGKRVVVIGSGATAVTLVPAMSAKASHVTMLQRSPTYVVSLPREDVLSMRLRRFLPARLVYRLARARYLAVSATMFRLARQRPAAIRRFLLKRVKAELGEGFDMKHFTPSYKPWDQRLCAVADGDLFKAIRDGKVSVVTDQIETFTEKGLLLKSGAELEADLIVTATGFDLQLFGGMQLEVDGRPVRMSDTMSYKGMMFRDVPNLSLSLGYTNASWTLKADLIAEYVCRLLKHLDATGNRQCTPRNHDPTVQETAFMELNSGYFQRAAARLPRQGSKEPWRSAQSYAVDLAALRFGKVDDQVMEFGNPARSPVKREAVVG
jgi:cation diffusion facilitator CzcD-associated flavoprotein CzcO